MSIYATEVADVIQSVPITTKKGGGKKKVDETPEVPAVKVKKPRSEAQIAATAKAAATRKANKEKHDAEIAEVRRQVEATEQELAKAIANKKRKSKTQEKTPSVSTTDEIVDQAIEKVVKKPRIKKEKKIAVAPPPEEPPAYLQKYIQGMLKTQNEASEIKKPAKQIREEAVKQSQDTWADGLKRDTVKNEVDSHMNRMYRMMFAR